MDEKIKEIERVLNRFKSVDPNSLLQSEQVHMKQIEYLLSRIKELEGELSRIKLGLGNDYGDDPIGVINSLKARVKELKKELKCSRISDEDLQKLCADE